MEINEAIQYTFLLMAWSAGRVNTYAIIRAMYSELLKFHKRNQTLTLKLTAAIERGFALIFLNTEALHIGNRDSGFEYFLELIDELTCRMGNRALEYKLTRFWRLQKDLMTEAAEAIVSNPKDFGYRETSRKDQTTDLLLQMTELGTELEPSLIFVGLREFKMPKDGIPLAKKPSTKVGDLMFDLSRRFSTARYTATDPSNIPSTSRATPMPMINMTEEVEDALRNSLEWMYNESTRQPLKRKSTEQAEASCSKQPKQREESASWANLRNVCHETATFLRKRRQTGFKNWTSFDAMYRQVGPIALTMEPLLAAIDSVEELMKTGIVGEVYTATEVLWRFTRAYRQFDRAHHIVYGEQLKTFHNEPYSTRTVRNLSEIMFERLGDHVRTDLASELMILMGPLGKSIDHIGGGSSPPAPHNRLKFTTVRYLAEKFELISSKVFDNDGLVLPSLIQPIQLANAMLYICDH